MMPQSLLVLVLAPMCLGDAAADGESGSGGDDGELLAADSGDGRRWCQSLLVLALGSDVWAMAAAEKTGDGSGERNPAMAGGKIGVRFRKKKKKKKRGKIKNGSVFLCLGRIFCTRVGFLFWIK
ncbi:hypothetical protein Pfo_031516 [Paulownia fortunei]|nr:hypothetical protein Pfo_031516 [Paulownia fortunei]